MKYNEERIIEEISRYIKGTYGEHYSTTKDGFQVQDMLRHLNIDKDFCQANAIKYLCRYGKKAGKMPAQGGRLVASWPWLGNVLAVRWPCVP